MYSSSLYMQLFCYSSLFSIISLIRILQNVEYVIFLSLNVFHIDIDLTSARIRLSIAPISVTSQMSRSHCLFLFIAFFWSTYTQADQSTVLVIPLQHTLVMGWHRYFESVSVFRIFVGTLKRRYRYRYF